MKRMMAVSIGIIGWFTFYSTVYPVTSAEQDLQTTYQTEKKIVADLLSKLTPLPDAVKKTWLVSLNGVESKIDKIYSTALEAIKPLEPKTQSTNLIEKLDAAEQISSISTTAQQNIKQLVSLVFIDVDQQLTNYLNSQQAVENKEALAKQAEEEKKVQLAQQAYQKRMAAELEGIEKIYGSFTKALQAMQLFGLETYKKPYDVSKVDAIVQQWQSVAALAFKVYSSFGSIDVNDSNSLLIASLKNIGNFLLDRTYDQVAALHNKKLGDDYYKLLSDTVIRLLGTNNPKDIALVRYGYDGVVQNEIKKYFTDANEQATLVNDYWKKKIQITFNVYKNALQTLANTMTNPTEQQRAYALAFYNGLMSELSVMSQSNKTVKEDINLINTAMAILYVNSAQSLLKSLQMAQDNTASITKLIEYYKQAASYFTQAGEGAQAQENLNLSKNLSDALAALAQAKIMQRSGDSNKTITYYKQAQTFFEQGADLLDANKVLIILSDLESNYALKTAGELFNKFESSNKTNIEAYLNYSNSLDGTLISDQASQLFSDLLQLYQAVYGYYQDALASYKAVRTNNPLLPQSVDIERLNNNLSVAVDLLMSLRQAYEALQNGDRLLQLKTVANLQDAESTYYQNALQLFKKADLLYAANQELNKFVPSFFLNKVTETPFNFEILAQRYIAKSSIELAGQITQYVEIELAYYINAYNRNQFLPLTFQNFLTSKLSQLAKSKDAVEKLFVEAQTNEKKLLAMTYADWVPKNVKGIYTSSASQQWDQLLQQYISLYHLGKIEAKAAFINAVNEYAENYKKYVTVNPELGLAMLWYQQFILRINDNEEEEAVALKQKIDKLLEVSYGDIQGLLSAIVNQANLLTTATIDQEKVIIWAEQIDQALDQQKNILTSVGISLTPEQRTNCMMLEKEGKSETVLYTYITLKKTIELPNLILKLANLYNQVGDHYFNQKNYKIAYSAYSSARQRYTDAGQQITPQFIRRLALSNTLYLASLYRDLVIPQGQVSVAGMQVPESYELQLYGQSVPSDISKGFPNLDFLKTDPTKTTDFLINLAVELYIYNKINDPEKFTSLMPLVSLKYDELKINPVFTALDDNQKIAFVTMIGFAGKMKALFQERAAKKSMNFVLQQKADKQFVLYIYSLPIPRIVGTKNYYPRYPAVIVYYSWAATLFKPGPEDETISVGQASLPHGNDQQEYDAMVTKQVMTYLSEGYSYQEQLTKLQKSDAWKNLIKSNKKDMAVVLDSYSELKASVDTLFNQMISYYTVPLANDLVSKTNKNYKPIHTLIGVTYKNWGDTLKNFLVGDPLSFNYVDILKDILQKYIVAITTYNLDSSLYADIAVNHNFAGNLLVEQGKYFDSISYFYTAASLSKRIQPQTLEVQKTIDHYYLNYLSALTKGSTLKMGQFQKALTEPITIADTGETINFNDLLIKYLSKGSSAEAISAEEASTMEDLRNLVLDALIFYNVTNSYITQGISNIDAPSILTWLALDDKTIEKVHDSALELLTTFSKKNNIAFDTIGSVTLMMNRTNFPDGKDFVAMINTGFSLFENKVKSSSDTFNRAVGYSAIAQFALKLYEAFSYLFMYTFYGEISADAIKKSLKPSIDARTNDILSPSKLYIG